MTIALLSLLLQAGHVFQPVDPSWSLIEDTLEGHAGGFVVVKPKERPRRDCWHEKRYSEDGRERKLLRYDPQGRLRLEVDVVEDDRFARILRADGSLASYQHHRNSRLVDAFSVSADGRTVHHVQDGIGQLVAEGEDGAWTHLHLLPGITLAKDFRGDRCDRISIWIDADHFVWTPGREEHSLQASGEYWSVREETVDLQIMDLEIQADGKVGRRTLERSADVRTMQEWPAVWPKRRAAFLARTDDALRAAGQDWARVGIEFLRE